MFKKKFYYGDGTDHIVRMTQKQADAVNKCEFKEEKVVGEDGDYDLVLMKTNLTPKEMKHYNEGARILNSYLAKGTPVTYMDDSKPMLRPVKE